MSLKNFQYNKILREYDRRQLNNKHSLMIKYNEIYKKIPLFEAIDHKIASISSSYAKSAILGNDRAIDQLKFETQKLKKEKETLLRQYGYPVNYLMPSYICPKCKDTGYIEGEKCQCFKQAIVDLLYAQSNLKTIIVKENFDHFCFDYYNDEQIEPFCGLTPRKNISKIVLSCKNFIQHFDMEYENILLYGNTGVGKTFLANCIARELLNTAHTVIYLTAFQLFDILEKNKFYKNNNSWEIEDQFHGILDCDLLIIDDLGTELNNSFISSQLYLCINERHLSEKSTIISTNLSVDDLNDLYSERIFSRITSNYTLKKIFGDDIRIKKEFTP